MQRKVLIVVDQHRIAQGNRPVVHAAAKVDRVTLNLRSVFSHIPKRRVNETHALDADGCDQYEQRHYGCKSQTDTGCQRNRIFHQRCS
ncbi:Catechol 2,3-dioxygenase or other lactoylglutathione lyase family enzyme [Pseudomonas syringae pv. actinidiae]|uniref:Catechol 2,3-dioxygenase or other lactoylglutathione lyase family enzyme n=1 Tax=Pseudomonas syringae pv. actinidiae TaxID=103796 RepID=A0AAN4Q8I4_PSESF|nr:Catechol 2,3-dioxygenase or other lactoylglutathione lyase family enzyme [Pseudomonas syringae pv. actinidiae]